jgi:hypothetical protein
MKPLPSRSNTLNASAMVFFKIHKIWESDFGIFYKNKYPSLLKKNRIRKRVSNLADGILLAHPPAHHLEKLIEADLTIPWRNKVRREGGSEGVN